MIEPNGSVGGESGDIFRISPPEVHRTPPLTAVFSLCIVDGQKVPICLLGVAGWTGEVNGGKKNEAGYGTSEF